MCKVFLAHSIPRRPPNQPYLCRKGANYKQTLLRCGTCCALESHVLCHDRKISVYDYKEIPVKDLHKWEWKENAYSKRDGCFVFACIKSCPSHYHFTTDIDFIKYKGYCIVITLNWLIDANSALYCTPCSCYSLVNTCRHFSGY